MERSYKIMLFIMCDVLSKSSSAFEPKKLQFPNFVAPAEHIQIKDAQRQEEVQQKIGFHID